MSAEARPTGDDDDDDDDGDGDDDDDDNDDSTSTHIYNHLSYFFHIDLTKSIQGTMGWLSGIQKP